MNTSEILDIVAGCKFPGFDFIVGKYPGTGVVFVMVSFEAPCSITGAVQRWNGRKWPISAHACESEIVGTCFLAVTVAREHEAREFFKWEGRAIFNPHVDVRAHWEKAQQIVGREMPQ